MKRTRGFLSGVWKRMSTGWAPYLEQTVAAEEVSVAMVHASVPSFGYFFMLGLAALIATFGLIVNSAPTIIGAMIISPLMSPILSLSYGLVTFDPKLITRSILTVAVGAVLVVAIAFAGSLLTGFRLAGSEILSRTSPTLFDLGVALAAGGAAAFSQTRRSIGNSIAGVAIAVALVPPLAVSGIGLALGRRAALESGISLTEFGSYGGGVDIPTGALVLFLANLAGIIVVAMLVFIFQKYGEWKKALLALVAVSTASVFLLDPLHRALYELYVKNRVVGLFVEVAATRPDIASGRGKLEALNVAYRAGVLHVYADVFVPRERMENLQGRIEKFRELLTADIGEPVVLEVDMIPVEIAAIRSEPPGLAKPRN